MKLFIVFILGLVLVGCATFAPSSGSNQIQKKCHPVSGIIDTYVCEQP